MILKKAVDRFLPRVALRKKSTKSIYLLILNF